MDLVRRKNPLDRWLDLCNTVRYFFWGYANGQAFRPKITNVVEPRARTNSWFCDTSDAGKRIVWNRVQFGRSACYKWRQRWEWWICLAFISCRANKLSVPSLLYILFVLVMVWIICDYTVCVNISRWWCERWTGWGYWLTCLTQHTRLSSLCSRPRVVQSYFHILLLKRCAILPATFQTISWGVW
jgi:hypothetical protein